MSFVVASSAVPFWLAVTVGAAWASVAVAVALFEFGGLGPRRLAGPQVHRLRPRARRPGRNGITTAVQGLNDTQTAAGGRRVEAFALRIRPTLKAVARLVMAVARLGAIAAGLIAVAVVSVTRLGPVAARMLTGAGHVGNPAPPGDIALAPLEQRSRVLASDGAELAVLHGEHNRELVALADLPPIVPAAVITAEDRRFAEHAGYDPRGIARAALTNLREGRMAAGGSTITQQVAKANFTDGARTLKRKLVELGYARALEAQLSKDEILERYLNEVYVGRGAYGVAAGAQAFFGRDVADLEVHHAALLAGMIAAPEHFDPIRHPELATARRNHVLAGMVDEDHLSPVRADLAANQPLDVVAFHRLQPRDPYVIEQVKRELLAEPALGDTRQQRIDALFSGGLQIHTSIDWRLQEHADLAVLSTHERVPGEPLELADDPHEGQKVTVVG